MSRTAPLALALLLSGCDPKPAAPTTPADPPPTLTAGRLSDDAAKYKGQPVRVYAVPRACGADCWCVRWAGGPRSPVVFRFAPGSRRPGGGAGYVSGTCEGTTRDRPPGADCPAPLVLVTGCSWEPES